MAHRYWLAMSSYRVNDAMRLASWLRYGNRIVYGACIPNYHHSHVRCIVNGMKRTVRACRCMCCNNEKTCCWTMHYTENE